MLTKILLLEDDFLLGESLQDFLEEEGFCVVLCRNGHDALEMTYTQKFDLYLLDINVPLMDGLSLLRALRGSNDHTPAIYITSHTEMEMLNHAFEGGADDYLKKPFHTEELLIRLKATLRRHKPLMVTVGDLKLNEQHKSILLGERELVLSPKEYQLMVLLIRYSGETVTKEMIIDELWSASESISEGSIRVYITRLKQEIGEDRILNIRGLGYRLVS